MKLTQTDVARLRSWKEGECCEQDHSRPNDTQHQQPMLPKVVFQIVGRHACKAKTARGRLKRLIVAAKLVIEVLKGTT